MLTKPHFAIPEIKARADIHEVWSALGGNTLRRGRGRAFWRGADGFNVSLDARQGLWYDHAAADGGDVITLVMRARQCDFRAAVAWLADFVGVQVPPDAGTHGEYSPDRAWQADLQLAEWWRTAAIRLAELDLETLSDCDPRRSVPTALLAALSLGPTTLVAEYRRARTEDPKLTAGVVHAGRRAEVRLQRRVAQFLAEMADNAEA
jgi:hypothetical protein